MGITKPLERHIGSNRLDFELDDVNWRDAFSKPGGLVARHHWMTPGQFVVFRVVIFLLWLGAVAWSTGASIYYERYAWWWIKLTHLGATTELIYFAFAATTTYLAVYGKIADGRGDQTPWFVSVTWCLSSLVPVVSLMIFCLYWLLVFKPGPGQPEILSCVMHGGNFFLAIVDLCLCRQPFYVEHVYVPFVFCSAYVTFSFVYYTLGGTNESGEPYIYEAVDWRNFGHTSKLLGVIVILGVPILYAIMFAVVAMRVRARKLLKEEHKAKLIPQA